MTERTPAQEAASALSKIRWSKMTRQDRIAYGKRVSETRMRVLTPAQRKAIAKKGAAASVKVRQANARKRKAAEKARKKQ